MLTTQSLASARWHLRRYQDQRPRWQMGQTAMHSRQHELRVGAVVFIDGRVKAYPKQVGLGADLFHVAGKREASLAQACFDQFSRSRLTDRIRLAQGKPLVFQ